MIVSVIELSLDQVPKARERRRRDLLALGMRCLRFSRTQIIKTHTKQTKPQKGRKIHTGAIGNPSCHAPGVGPIGCTKVRSHSGIAAAKTHVAISDRWTVTRRTTSSSNQWGSLSRSLRRRSVVKHSIL